MRNLLAVVVALIGFSLAMDVDARRMGGGRSIGKQRETVNQNQATQRSQQQQQQQAAPAQQQQAVPAATPPARQPSGFSRWLGPLAGLAIGAGLASLFFNNGLGGALMGILLLAALVFGAVMLFRLLRGRGQAREPLRYAGADPYVRREPTSSPTAFPSSGAPAPHSVAATTQGSHATPPSARAPLDFDSEQFLRHARKHFAELQAAHDRRDLATIRDFLTPELYREIEADVRASGDTPQKTEVVTLDAEVLDVTSENGLYVVSVRFSGLIREQPGAEPQPFTEIWHLEKPVNGRSGWLVSGIQQS
jgi:predicted lipid-binding transport protein (Tim44 family)